MSEAHENSSSHAPLTPPEPKSPAWLPALGAVLFLMAGLLWALWPSSTPAGAAAPAGGAAPAGAASAQGAAR